MTWRIFTPLVAISAASIMAIAAPAGAESKGPRLTDLAKAELTERQKVDLAAVGTYRSGLAQTVAFARSRPELFPVIQPNGAHLLTAVERNAVHTAWKSMLDYTLALESIENFHDDFALLANTGARARSFHVANGAFLAAYRFALDFIDLAAGDPKLAIILNDPVEDLGLPAGSYDRYKFRYLNVAAATRFAAYGLAGQLLGKPPDMVRAREAAEDSTRILAAGRGRGEALTAANAVNVLRGLGFQAVFPVQTGISIWMGDTKVLRTARSLISPEQVETLRALMRPGDIMLQRREWYLSNVGLPGFWSHAAIYVGTPDERRAYFDDEEVHSWVISRGEPSGDLNRLLERTFPASRAARLLPPEHGHAQRVIEAISEGVVFTTLEHSLAADSVVVLRPRLSRAAIAAAFVRAWGYVGRPYDFDFDFQTDSALVCTELVYKAFEPSATAPGLHLALEEIVGRTAIPANAIAHQFDTQFGTAEAQFDFITFLDGLEKADIAVEAGVEDFRKSWRRPKWHVLVQEPAGNAGAR
jgi:hypothetical protein